jgi:hypothetical protein
MIELINSGAALSVEALNNFELEFGIALPQELRELYLRANGGKPNRQMFIDENGPCKVHTILPIKHSSIPGLSTLDQSFNHMKVRAKILRDDLVPFAVDPLGGYFCFSSEGDSKGSVWIVHMDGSAGPEYLTPNVKYFFDRLT